MIQKIIKEYKQGDRNVQRINILKNDNLKGKVYILTSNEYERLQTENKSLKTKIDKDEDEIKKLNAKIEKIEYKLKNIKESEQLLHQTIKELNKEQVDYLKQIYDDFNKELKKYITVNQLQNQALEQILELGLIDIIRNKHKKIAKKQIKELDTDVVYELTPKK